MAKQLEKQELKSIQDAQLNFNKSKMQLADNALQQQAIIKEIDEIKSNFAVLEQDLIKKYGQDSSINMETGEVKSGDEVKVNPRDVREEYVKGITEFAAELKLKCGQYGIDFVEADINAGFNQILLQYLVKRKKML